MTTEQTNNAKFFRVVLLSAIGAIVVLLTLSGCKTPAKMLRKHDKIQAKCDGIKRLDTVGASWCNTNYPVEAKTTVRTKYVRGKTIVKTDTTTLTETVKDTVIKTVTVNRWHNTTDTQYIDTSRTVLDTRKVELCQAELTGWIDEASKYKQKYEAERTTKRKWRNAAYITWFGIALLLALTLGWKWVKSKWNVFVK